MDYNSIVILQFFVFKVTYIWEEGTRHFLSNVALHIANALYLIEYLVRVLSCKYFFVFSGLVQEVAFGFGFAAAKIGVGRLCRVYLVFCSFLGGKCI